MIKDSGTRTDFESGAVRDMGKGKGRFELLPLRELSEVLVAKDAVITYMLLLETDIERNADYETFKIDINNMLMCLNAYLTDDESYNILLRLAVHAEEGALKYGDLNWQKGIPLMSYFNSAMRHYCKFRAGWKDEPHEIAFIWNLAAMLWTKKNIVDKEK